MHDWLWIMFTDWTNKRSDTFRVDKLNSPIPRITSSRFLGIKITEKELNEIIHFRRQEKDQQEYSDLRVNYEFLHWVFLNSEKTRQEWEHTNKKRKRKRKRTERLTEAKQLKCNVGCL